MNLKWPINPNQSDVLIKTNHSVIAYLGDSTNFFSGYVVMNQDTIEDAEVEFSLDLINNFNKKVQMNSITKLSNYIDAKTYPTIRFKSTSFQKVNKNINFIKGDLTIKDVTKTLELDTEFIGIHNYDGQQKASVEVSAKLKRSDFDLMHNMNNLHGGFSIGQDLKLVANLEFEIL